MSTNTTNNGTSSSTDNGDGSRDGMQNIPMAVVLPCLFAVLLLAVLVQGWLLPRCIPAFRDRGVREQRWPSLLQLVDGQCKAVHYQDWKKKADKKHHELVADHNICVVCLDKIGDKDLVRGLRCLHVFHKQCLDDWCVRGHVFCPLCHRPILPEYQYHTSSDELVRMV